MGLGEWAGKKELREREVIGDDGVGRKGDTGIDERGVRR